MTTTTIIEQNGITCVISSKYPEKHWHVAKIFSGMPLRKEFDHNEVKHIYPDTAMVNWEGIVNGGVASIYDGKAQIVYE